MKSQQSPLLRLGIFMIVFFVVGTVGWLWWSDSISPVDTTDTTPIVFAVASGEGIKGIATNLTSENLIRSSTGFYMLVKILGMERNIQAGEFRLNRSMSARAIALELTHGISDEWLTTLEGWRVEEIATKLSKELDIPENEFLRNAREGYMFPDTYLISHESTPAAIAALFQKTFDEKVTAKMRQDSTRNGLSFDQVLTLASIVEREAAGSEDRPIIAGILLKRLKAKWPLQTDATIQYALGYQAKEKSWWKKSLTREDIDLDSPFNTYKNPGLPPHPIANPGLDAINAVIYPKDTEYWYYLHDPKGGVHFGKTIEDHNRNISTYL